MWVTSFLVASITYGRWALTITIFIGVTEGCQAPYHGQCSWGYCPTGLCRTYPNLMGNESARGTEYESFAGNKAFPYHCIAFHSFTRWSYRIIPWYLEGDMNRIDPKQASSLSTLPWLRQVGIVCYDDTVHCRWQLISRENYEKYADAFQFITDVAIDWDESRYLEAEPGQYITIALQG